MFGDDYHRSLEHIGGAGGERRQGDRGTDIAVASCCRSPSILAHGSGRGNLAPWWWLRFKEPPIEYSYFNRTVSSFQSSELVGPEAGLMPDFQ
jgi:hypothetical protein